MKYSDEIFSHCKTLVRVCILGDNLYAMYFPLKRARNRFCIFRAKLIVFAGPNFAWKESNSYDIYCLLCKL